jgi:uncharacterized membrane protein
MDTATLQLVLRWVHLVAGITWIGLLFFFNLVNFSFMREMVPAIKPQVFPALMRPALFWFRWSALVTVIAGIWYWMMIVGTDARNARLLATSAEQASNIRSGWTIGSFFLFWTLAWLLTFLVVMVARTDKPLIVGLVYTVAVVAAGYGYLTTNHHGWESNRLLCIGIGGGMGWVMLLNVWGVIWRVNKKMIRWMSDSAADGSPLPPNAASFARIGFLTSRANFALAFPMLLFMAAASHFSLFLQ